MRPSDMGIGRFEIIAGHYWFCTHYHGGGGSKLYARLSKISGYFKPGVCRSDGPHEEGDRLVYNALEEKHGFQPTLWEGLDE